MTTHTLPDLDLSVDRALADIAGSFRFLLDVTPVDLVDARDGFWRTGRAPEFRYRELADDPVVTTARLADVPVNEVEDATVAHLLQAKHRELLLLLQMLASRGTSDFLALSIEAFGAVGPTLLHEAEEILEQVPHDAPDPGPWLDADAFAQLAQAELDRYRAFAPDIESHVELRAGSTGVMVSNGDVLIAPTARISAARAEALLQHEIGTHVVTYVNGAHQPLRVLASGLAGTEETQEGLAVFAEYLVGGLTANRLRQLAARVVAVHQMLAGVEFPEVHAGLVAVGVPKEQSFTITMRVFRSGGLTKDAVYLRGLQELVGHIAAGKPIETLWLGKMPLDAVPLVEDLHQRGLLLDPLLVPRYLDHPGARQRLAHPRGHFVGLTRRRSTVKIGFVINDIAIEKPEYTTVRLALVAAARGHDTWLMGVGDFSHHADGTVAVHARRAVAQPGDDEPTFLARVQDDERESELVAVADLDVLVMRNDPADDMTERPWAVTSGVLFAQLSVAAGTLVVNDPASLANAVNKTYFQHFPEIVRPRTLISRDPGELAAFVEASDGAVLKPLQGSGGAGVFFVSDEESPNLNQMIEALSRDGYIVAQENLPQAEQGDVRLFLMNGVPLTVDGRHAAFRRVNTSTDPRSNMRVGGEPEPVEVDDEMLAVAEAVRPKLLADGMFLVGLDIVGSKLMEVNVFSPGGLGNCETLYGVKFTDAVIDALEHKVDLQGQSRNALENVDLATL